MLKNRSKYAKSVKNSQNGMKMAILTHYPLWRSPLETSIRFGGKKTYKVSTAPAPCGATAQYTCGATARCDSRAFANGIIGGFGSGPVWFGVVFPVRDRVCFGHFFVKRVMKRKNGWMPYQLVKPSASDRNDGCEASSPLGVKHTIKELNKERTWGTVEPYRLGGTQEYKITGRTKGVFNLSLRFQHLRVHESDTGQK
ncbi:hypothetical protein B0H17DRAFT_1125105 [Mycena rosella]|uniref:Uncharacterized protein n=1 Tax=Mycena rosella TaxID=1033263 RepID=A0AAD7MAZ7_MYCRO|nr:hypothetical protein B0H17DRAFT_1125105 [Mycena rosella]